MCGFAGFFASPRSDDAASWPGRLDRMGQAIRHRGPDASGIWFDAEPGIGLVHRRLAIIDLSPAGHQPMVSANGQLVLAFNGEIYNHLAIRRELEQVSNSLAEGAWRGHSDTETLIAAISAWGLDKALRKTVGMFALALWDRATHTLSLARDRLGEKPLYYGLQGGTLLFGSELKALRAHPAFAAAVDRDALALYLRHSCVPSPYSIYQGISKLPPGAWLQIDSRALQQRTLPLPMRYWSLSEVIAHGRTHAFVGSDAEAVDALQQRLADAVALQQVADVPLGAFLSGGVDSSTIVALMQAQSTRQIKTFTIGFHEDGFNEAEHAATVARHLGTDHTELYVTAAQAQAVIPGLPMVYDEPFADVSQIPTCLVAGLARRTVTVSLSGDAGDELFGGYNRYLLVRAVWRKLARLPHPMRRMLAQLLALPSAGTWNTLYRALQPVLPTRARINQPGDKLPKLIGLVSATSPEDLYTRLVSHCMQPASLVLGAQEPPSLLNQRQSWPQTTDFEHWMMAMDTQTYLPDDILTKVDRAAMAASLETRVPLLDHRVVELAWQLPLGMKLRQGRGKWLLRQVLDRHVPAALIDRPKMGFSVPIDHWLRGPLRGWADALLDGQRLRQEGYLQPAPIVRMWQEHRSGRRNWHHQLWDVLMFQAWLAREAPT